MASSSSFDPDEVYRVLFEQARDGIFVADAQGRYLTVNASGHALLGYAPGELIGKTILDIIRPEDAARLREEMDSVRTGALVREWTLVRRDGGRIGVEITEQLLPNGLLLGVVRDLTERERDRQALRDSEERLRSLINALPEPAFILDRDLRVVVCNEALSRSLGVPLPQLVGGRMQDMLRDPTIARERFRRIGEVFDSRGPQVFEDRNHGRDYRNFLYPVLMGEQVKGVAVFAIDVTEARAAQEKTLHFEALYRSVLETAPDYILTVDRDGKILFINRTATAQTVEQIVGTSCYDHVPDEARATVRDALERVFTKGEIVEYDTQGPVLPNGERIWSHVHVGPLVRDGAIVAATMCAADITSRVKAEQALRESEARLSAIVASTPNVAIQTYDRTGRVLSWNKASEGMFGFGAEEALGRTLDQLIHTPEECRYFREMLGRIHTTGEAVGPAEYQFRRKDGSRGWCLSTTFGIPTGSEPVFVCMDVDISARKATDDALRLSEQRYRTLFDHAPEALVILDLDAGHFVEVNPQAEALFGLPQAQLLKLNPLDLSAPLTPDGRHAPEAAREYFRQAMESGEPVVFEWTHRDSEGFDLASEVRLVRIPDPERRLVRGSIIDIRERKRLEEQLLQVQRVESIGRLAGGVAHDFNNLLTSIMGFAELARIGLPPDTKPARQLSRLLEAAGRGANLTQQLLAYARKKIVRPEVLDLNRVVAGIEPMLRRLIGEDLNFVFVPAQDLSPVKVDLGSMEQVIVNLAVNARDAMPHGGQLTVETQNVTLDARYAAAHADVAPGPYAMLAVSDSGVGMSEAVRKQVFDPFFTTKPVGQGTGLGLAMCHGIVKQAGGHIAVYSEEGQGATFKVYLPVCSEKGAAPARSAATERLTGGTETVLFVEDEPLVRDFACQCLGDLGYTVLDASNGVDAVERIARHASPVHLLVTDVVMPRMSGSELARRLAQSHPGLKVLFTSGYTENAIVHHGVLNADVNFLQKPYSPIALAKKVREVLDRSI
ncbi:MAG: histidine kinase [Planctomycetota bacterium]